MHNPTSNMLNASEASEHNGTCRIAPATPSLARRAMAGRRLVVLMAAAAATCAGLLAVRSFAQGELNPPQYAHGAPVATALDHISLINQAVLPATFHLIAEFPDGRTTRGTGFIIEGDGKAFTHAPLVHGASRIRVRMSDATWHDATIAFADVSTGVAGLVVKFPPGTTILTVGLGHTEETALGENVATVGMPSGVLPVISVGRLAGSGIVMDERTQRTAFAITDALVSKSTVGGPVVAADGRVIGIATDADGVVVPISTAQRLLGIWRDRGQMAYSTIGVTLAPVRDFARGTQADGNFGCVILRVEPRTPADDAGLLSGDRLLEVDGIPINAIEEEVMPQFRLMLDMFPADKPLKVMVRRNEEIITTEIVPMADAPLK